MFCGTALIVLGQDYEVNGAYVSKAYLGTNVSDEGVYDFKIIVNDGQWLLNANERERKLRGVLQTNHFDCIRAGFDGKQFYTLYSLETIAKLNPKSVNVAVGSVGKKNIPIDAEPIIKNLWLGFASQSYFASLTDDWLYPLYQNSKDAQLIEGRFLVKGHREMLPGSKSLPANVVYTLEFDGKFLDERLRNQFNEWTGHTIAIFSVQQYTNFGVFAVPTRFNVKCFSPDGKLSLQSEATAIVSRLPTNASIATFKFPTDSYITDIDHPEVPVKVSVLEKIWADFSKRSQMKATP